MLGCQAERRPEENCGREATRNHQEGGIRSGAEGFRGREKDDLGEAYAQRILISFGISYLISSY